MKPYPLIEIELDRPRKLLIDHAALFRAEQEINRLRGARPEEHLSIDTLMVEAYNRVLRMTGLLPIDLLFVMLWAALLHEDPKLEVNRMAALMESSPLSRVELSARLWETYFKSAGKNLVERNDGGEEEKKNQPIGSDNGASGESS